MKERDEFPELSELMLIGAPHVVAASRKEPDLRTVSVYYLDPRVSDLNAARIIRLSNGCPTSGRRVHKYDYS